MSPAKNSRLIRNSHLVIEQRGSLVLFSGLLLSFILGLTIKAVFSPARIQFEVEKVISESKAKASISTKTAYLSLSDGIWPRLAVVVEGVKIDSQDPCVGQAWAEVDEFDIPVTLTSLFSRRLVLEEIEIKNFSIHLRQEIACIGKQDRTTPGLKALVDPQSSIETSDSSQENFNREAPLVKTISIESPMLKSIRINTLKVTSDLKPGVSFLLSDVFVAVNPESGIIAVLDSHVALSHASIPKERDIKGKVLLRYLDKNKLDGEIKGTWREGSFNLGLNASQEKTGVLYSLTGDLRHIPLSQIIPLLNYYGILEKTYSGKQAWISSQLLVDNEKIDLSQLRFEGEFGEMLAPAIRVKNSDPLVFDPFKVEFRKVDINNLGASFDYKNPWKFLAHLGVVDGILAVRTSTDLTFNGKIAGTEFIFSNKGRRDVQTLDNANFIFTKNNTQSEMTVTNLALKDGFFDGVWILESSDDLNRVKVSTTINQLVLSPRIENLMTSAGKLGAIKGRLLFVFNQSQLSKVDGFLKIKESVIERVRVDEVDLNFSKNNSESGQDPLNIEGKVSKIDFSGQEAIADFLTLVPEKNQFYKFNSLNWKITLNRDGSVQWSPLTGKGDRTGFDSTGGWNSSGVMDGSIKFSSDLKIFDKKTKSYRIQGQRSNPSLEEVL